VDHIAKPMSRTNQPGVINTKQFVERTTWLLQTVDDRVRFDCIADEENFLTDRIYVPNR
jgi:hypothetical protein